MNERKRAAIAAAIVVLAILGWHLYLNLRIKERALAGGVANGTKKVYIRLNPITDRVTIGIHEDPPMIGSGDAFLRSMVALAGPAIDKAMNHGAHRHADCYAMLVPYNSNLEIEAPTPAEMAVFHTREKADAEARTAAGKADASATTQNQAQERIRRECLFLVLGVPEHPSTDSTCQATAGVGQTVTVPCPAKGKCKGKIDVHVLGPPNSIGSVVCGDTGVARCMVTANNTCDDSNSGPETKADGGTCTAIGTSIAGAWVICTVIDP
jgi:hypothetical protein